MEYKAEDLESEDLKAVFNQQKECWIKHPYPDYHARINNLKDLRGILLDNQNKIIQAISKDFGFRSEYETKVFEFLPSLEAIDYAINNLKTWLKPKKICISKWFWPSKGYLHSQPKGVVGIISPWNYPLFLAIAPLVSALAAGNRVMLKLSEHSDNISSLLKELLGTIFVETKVTVVLGGAFIAEKFSQLPFGHLFYTGSTEVGRKVMLSAGKNLTPLTLELGGKSPAILVANEVKYDYISKIWFGKIINSGQTCIAPDYIWLPRSDKSNRDQIIQYSKLALTNRFHWLSPENKYQLTGIINENNYYRIIKLVEDAIEKGAIFEPLVKLENNNWHSINNGLYRIAPCLLLNANHTMQIMQEEIFGPILPVMEYDTIEQLLFSLQVVPDPLVMYLFTKESNLVNMINIHSTSGALSVNATIVYAASEALPFGGSGDSGMGRYRGKAGFDTFSVLKTIYKQSRLDVFTMIYPPVKTWQKKLLKFIIK